MRHASWAITRVEKREMDSTCFANMPYVTGEFRPPEKRIRGVDHTASLAGVFSAILGSRDKRTDL